MSFENAGSLFGAPEEALLPPDEADKILRRTVRISLLPMFDGDYQGYLAERRKLIGPRSDITHVDFGVPQKDTNYRLAYEVSVLPAQKRTVDEHGNTIYTKTQGLAVREHIFEPGGGLISTQDL